MNDLGNVLVATGVALNFIDANALHTHGGLRFLFELLLGTDDHFVQNLQGFAQAKVHNRGFGLRDLDFKLRLAFIADKADGNVVQARHHAAQFKVSIKIRGSLNRAALNAYNSPRNGVVAGVVYDGATNDLRLGNPRYG